MERIVKRGVVGGIVGGLFGLFITVPWGPLFGIDEPLLQMALPMTVAFALFGAWFASIPCLADAENARTEHASRVGATHGRLAA
jgi:uncharacterized YccA/Bax inhibitor family protein